jgi:hypothetical protein
MRPVHYLDKTDFFAGCCFGHRQSEGSLNVRRKVLSEEVLAGHS